MICNDYQVNVADKVRSVSPLTPAHVLKYHAKDLGSSSNCQLEHGRHRLLIEL